VTPVIRFFITVLLLFFLSACAKPMMQPTDWHDPLLTKVWPKAPATPRIKLLRVVGSLSDLRSEDRSGRFFKWLFGSSDNILPLVSPYGICADGDGRIWLADPGGGAVHVYDLAGKTIDYIVQAGDRRLISPIGVAVDIGRQRLYVSDGAQKEVFVFDLEGTFVETLDYSYGFGRPAGMAVSLTGDLYVADVLKGKIIQFSPEGVHLYTIGSAAAKDRLFNRPTAVAVDADGNVYVSDSLNFRIVVQSAAGELIQVIGEIGDAPGSLSRPRGVALDSKGHIYIVDAAFDNIQIFDLTGQLLLDFGKPGKSGGEFCLPAGIFIDKNNRIYVAESCNGRFQIFEYLDNETVQ
jgi:DNA-binding beta-propeller fold protein YncE